MDIQTLEENLKRSCNGRQLWLKLLDKYTISGNDRIILFPSLNNEYNYYGLLYIEQFMESTNALNLYILTYDERIINNLSCFTDKGTVIPYTREQLEEIILFYCLYQFTDKLTIVSLDEPDGRNGTGLLGQNGLTTEEIIAIGIYGLKDFKKIEATGKSIVFE